MSDQKQDQSLRKLWQSGQSTLIPDSTRDALFAERDLAVEQALDSVGTHPRAAELVRAVSGLRGDAEQLSREIKLLRVPQRSRQPVRVHFRWATAAAVVVLASWVGLSNDAPQPAADVVATEASGPAVEGVGHDAERDRIVSASFEGAEQSAAPREGIFGAGFDS